MSDIFTLITPKTKAIRCEYSLDHNGAQAAIGAGFARRSARQTASDLLAKTDIQAEVARHEAAAAKQPAVTKERVIAELQQAIQVARLKGNPPV